MSIVRDDVIVYFLDHDRGTIREVAESIGRTYNTTYNRMMKLQAEGVLRVAEMIVVRNVPTRIFELVPEPVEAVDTQPFRDPLVAALFGEASC